MRRILPGLGIQAVTSSEACDATLHLSLQGWALAEDYVCIVGNACGHCFTGAQVIGELTLTRSDRAPWVHALSASIMPPSTISACPEAPGKAPLDRVWSRATLDGLLDLWGTPILVVALGDQEESVRSSAVQLLETQGDEGIPFLVRALQDQSADVREQAANALGSQGTRAREAAPALIELLDDHDRPVRLAAASALHQITGQDLGQDQAAWEKWLEEPDLTPTPLTSWNEVPIMPGAASLEELGDLFQYVVQASCGEVAAFYQAEMPGTGWTFVESESPGGSFQQLKFEKGRETAEVWLNHTWMTESSGCSVQIFLLH